MMNADGREAMAWSSSRLNTSNHTSFTRVKRDFHSAHRSSTLRVSPVDCIILSPAQPPVELVWPRAAAVQLRRFILVWEIREWQD